MSEDIYYHSFSPRKSDEEWARTKEDIKIIADKIAKITPDDYKSPKAREKKFLQMRKEHDDYLEKLGEPLLRSLAKQGKDRGITDYRDVVESVEVVPDNSNQYNVADARYRPAQYAERITISSGDTRADDQYLQTFLQFKDEEDKAKYDTDVPKLEPDILSEQQQKILSILWSFFYNPDLTKKEILNDFVSLDLFLGAKTVKIEESRLEYDIVEALILHMRMETNNSLPTREDWIKLFKEKDIEGLQKTLEVIQSIIGQELATKVLHDYLKQILPVIRNLNETDDAIFIRSVDGSNISPASARKILSDRAKLHYQGVVNDNVS